MECEVLFWNGKIWLSGYEDRTWLTFSTKTGRITNLGKSNLPDLQLFDNVVNLNGSRVFPGFHDSHIHVSLLGKSLMSVDLRGCTSIENMQVVCL